MEKSFDPQLHEQKIYQQWEESGAFQPDPQGRESYTIVIPPPNITGSLHIGHALNNAIQDVLIRFNRMNGRRVLWQPGTDHASIATQMVVERRNAEQGLPTREVMGREEFLKRVWQWKGESGNAITNQLRALGASCDWSRERFTMDEGMSKAVIKVFVDLYNQGLIYKDTRLVNWDPKMGTAISDLEVIPTETDGSLWYFAYPIDGCGETIIVATTRPETMLGDSGVAVNPGDERYKHLVGKTITHPISGRKLIIVADDMADPEHGSGAVKLTPAHDFNDFNAGKRHNLPFITIFDKRACINDQAPTRYQGKTREEARKLIINEMTELGYFVKEEKIRHNVPFGERGGVPVEPLITEQWYVRADILAKPAIESVRSGRTKFFPENWAQTYFQWLENIQPWCISRQLWWGHRIPAYYAPDGTIFVAENQQLAEQQALQKFGKATPLIQDDDVLDTWFSSALWPFSTLGWPENTETLKNHYPTDVLVTGFDIIFFWVARMMMFGLHFMGREPFHTVYVHALVRDEFGRKMSKSKGNVIDPLTLINEFGCDAMRWTLINLSTPGRDIKLATSRVAASRNFVTKLWNAARYVLQNAPNAEQNWHPGQTKHLTNQWFLQQIKQTQIAIDNEIQQYRFDNATNILYGTIWNIFCDWYLEFTKPLLKSGDEQLVGETQNVLRFGIESLCQLAHPFLPFITEAIYQEFGHKNLLINEKTPNYGQLINFPQANDEMNWLCETISAVRSVRSQCHIQPHILMNCWVELNPKTDQYYQAHRNLLEKMARINPAPNARSANDKSLKVIVNGGMIHLAIDGVVDVGAEIARLTKAKAQLQKDIDGWQNKLQNPQFTSRAKPEVVDELRARTEMAEEEYHKISESLAIYEQV